MATNENKQDWGENDDRDLMGESDDALEPDELDDEENDDDLDEAEPDEDLDQETLIDTERLDAELPTEGDITGPPRLRGRDARRTAGLRETDRKDPRPGHHARGVGR